MWEVAVKDSLFLSSTQKEAIFFGLTGWRKNGRFPQNHIYKSPHIHLTFTLALVILYLVS